MAEQDVSDMSPEEIAELQKKNCIFCKIVAGEVDSKKVYEDDRMLAILDIRPAAKGHILVLPKDHYPILPVVPQEVSDHMLVMVKHLSRSVREGMPATGATVFFANGAAAGQQSPHFLFHIIPRDAGDGLSQFKIPMNNVDQSELLEPLRQRIGASMQRLLVKQGKIPAEASPDAARDKIAEILENNPQVRELLMNDPEKFKEMVTSNPQLQQLFQGVDIDQLSQRMGNIDTAGDGVSGTKNLPSSDQEEGSDSEESEDSGDDTNNGNGDDSRNEVSDDEGSDSGSKADLDKVSRLFK